MSQTKSLIASVSRKPYLSRAKKNKALLNAANQARDAKDYSEAALLYAAYLEFDGDNAAIQVQCGHMFKEAGSLASAERHYLKAWALIPLDPDLQLQLGHFYKISNRVDEAKIAYGRALALAPNWDAPRTEIEAIERSSHNTESSNIDNNKDSLKIIKPEQILLTQPSNAVQPTFAANTVPDQSLSAQQILETGLFDAKWYLERHSDVAGLGLDPLSHFATNGINEGRAPSVGFNGSRYCESYPEVAESGLNPFVHYALLGRQKGYLPAGEDPYTIWTKKFDTIGDDDRLAIARQIKDQMLQAPVVIVHVDKETTTDDVMHLIASLKMQILLPDRTIFCVSPDCSPATRLAIWALAGGEADFTIIDSDVRNPPMISSTQQSATKSSPACVVLLRTTAVLREHALYMLVNACRTGTSVVYADEDQIRSGRRVAPWFKPERSPILYSHTDYLGACVLLNGDHLITEALVEELVSGRMTQASLVKKAFFASLPEAIVHVPFVLFHFGPDRQMEAKQPHRRDNESQLPTVSIIIPTRNKVDLLRNCIESVLSNTDYPRYKFNIVVVDNDSSDWDALDYMDQVAENEHDAVIKVSGKFNYSRLNNIAVDQSKSDVIILLNNDTEIQDSFWLRRMVDLCMQPGVGAVGPKLLYSDGTIQHAGVVLNIGGVAAHACVGLRYDQPGYMNLAQLPHEVSAVTGACLAIRRSVFEEVGQLDEALAIACNDVALCLACLDHGYRNIYVPDVWVRHFESKTRGVDDTPAKVDAYLKEAEYTRSRFPDFFSADPYYSPNLNIELADLFEPAFPPRCRYPWKMLPKNGAPTRILLLSKTFDKSEPEDLTASAFAKYFIGINYNVFVGSESPQHNPQLAGATFAKLIDSRAAATFAYEQEIDVIVVFTQPYITTARLLGRTIYAILHCPETTLTSATEVQRRSDEIERNLDLSFFDLLVASSKLLADHFRTEDVLICPPGGDLLGQWNSISAQRRDLVRQARGWHGKTAVLIGVGPSDRRTDKLLGHLRDLIIALDGNDATFFVLDSSFPGLVGFADMSAKRPEQAALRDLYIAADIFLDLTDSDYASPEVAEAKAFGLPVVKGDNSFWNSELDKGVPGATLLPLERLLRRATIPGSRLASGATWENSLQPLHSAISRALEVTEFESAHFSVTSMSDRTLLGWSGMFDGAYYNRVHPEIPAAGHDPLAHFSDHGGREGRQPSNLFWTQWYLKTYPEVAASKANPLVHFLRQTGGSYDPNPFFCSRSYISDAGGTLQLDGLPPFVHYLRIGAYEGRSAGPNFDATFYSTTYPDIPADTLPLVHFLTEGAADGRMAVRPKFISLDVYDPADIAQACDIDEKSVTWRPVSASAVSDKRTAVRFCIDMVSKSPAIRARYPQALSGGVGGSFCQWLIKRGQEELGLSEKAIVVMRELFEEDFAAPILQAYLTSSELRTHHPFALLAPGIGGFVNWLVDTGIAKLEINIEQIRWFAIARYENPARELACTYQFNPAMQHQFPAGLTMFGQEAFTNWIIGLLPEEARSLIPTSWPSPLSVAEQIRLAYASSPAWQRAHPAPFESGSAATALVDWLKIQTVSLGSAIASQLSSLDTRKLTSELCVDGVNMIGHFCYPSGLRSSTTSLVTGYRSAGFRVSERDVWVETKEAEPFHASFGGLEVYDTTIIHTQPEPFFDVAYQRAGLAPRNPRTYRIGYWYWELDSIPASWLNQASQLDEIWTATRFVSDALRERIKVPIHEIMPGFELPPVTAKSRDYFGLPEDHYLFLFTFHMMSIMERKNPLGLIAAFRDAFAADEKVGLVLKTSYGEKHPVLMRELREAARGRNIIIIDEIYTQDDVLALMQSCDAYVSLHRSEGYGLTMMEAMLLGKPVIATAYSGNLDFMSRDTAVLVDYELVKLDRTIGPYEVGTQWAEPSISHAAECLRKVYKEPSFATALGMRAKLDLEKRLSYVAAGEKMAVRLAEIKELTAARATICVGDLPKPTAIKTSP